jgi:hypothetical protein
MHRIREGNIDGIDVGQTVVELVVATDVLEAVAPRHLTSLHPVVAHHRHQLRIPARMCEGG